MRNYKLFGVMKMAATAEGTDVVAGNGLQFVVLVAQTDPQRGHAA